MSYITNRKWVKRLRPRLKTAKPSFSTKSYGLTHVGCIRKANEDSFWMIPQNNLWIVADGMGGHAGGQLASSLTIQEMGKNTIKFLNEAEKTTKRIDVGVILKRAAESASSAVFEVAKAEPELASMGSTLTSLLIYEDAAYLAHIGDSRAYLFREGQLFQVTQDHSWVQEQVNFGVLTAEEANKHPYRNFILKSISSMSFAPPDIARVPLKTGDRFLLCSDGLVEHVSDEEIQRVFERCESAHIPSELISMTNSDHSNPRGPGTDNTTIVVIEVGSKRRAS